MRAPRMASRPMSPGCGQSGTKRSCGSAARPFWTIARSQASTGARSARTTRRKLPWAGLAKRFTSSRCATHTAPAGKPGPAVTVHPRARMGPESRRYDCAIQELRPPTNLPGARAMSDSSRCAMSAQRVTRGSSTKWKRGAAISMGLPYGPEVSVAVQANYVGARSSCNEL